MKKTSIIPKEAMPAVVAFRKPYEAYHEKRAALMAQIGALSEDIKELDAKTQPKLKRLYAAIGDALGIPLDDGTYYVDSGYAVEHGLAFLSTIEAGEGVIVEDEDESEDEDHTVH